ncbi:MULTISPECIES: hypothetical protein [Agrobacterium]|uniref:hypothetical protein n=1 Tax=Agrobacterium TaxID=357 RepID=UPI003BA2412E
MVISPVDRTTVMEAFKQGPSVYILGYVQESIRECRGKKAATEFERALIDLTKRFHAFKTEGLLIRSDREIEQLLEDNEAQNDLLGPYLFSSLALQAYWRCKADTALKLLEQAKRMDRSLIEENGIRAYHPHLIQSDQNICRMFLGSGRTADATSALKGMLSSLLRSFETNDPRLSVSLELMGMQMVSYLVGLIRASRIEDPTRRWDLNTFPPSHTLANIELWIAIGDGDKKAVFEKMINPKAVHFGILKQPAMALLSYPTELKHV